MKATLALLVLLFGNLLFAQQKFDKYCDVILVRKTIAVEYRVDQVDYGQKDGKFRFKDLANSRQLDSLENQVFSGSVTILDIMEHNGWKLVAAFPGNDPSITHLVFRRPFTSAEIVEKAN